MYIFDFQPLISHWGVSKSTFHSINQSMVISSPASNHVPTATFPEHTILSTATSTLAQPLRRTSTSQSQRSTSSSSTGQVGSRRPRILCLECSRLCSQRQNGSVHRRNCMVQLPSVRQHQHSSPAHIVIPAVNPISAPRLARLNNPMCSSHLQQTPLQPTLSFSFRAPST